MTDSQEPNRRSLARLEAPEKRIRAFIEDHLVADTGLLYSHLNVTTLKPWTNAQLAPLDLRTLHHPGRGDQAAVCAYEDTLMATTAAEARRRFRRMECSRKSRRIAAPYRRVV